MNTLHLPKVDGKQWAKRNPDTDLLEFFVCVDSGFYSQEDYFQVTDEFVEQYIAENYPHEEEPETEENEELNEEPQDSSNAVDTSVL